MKEIEILREQVFNKGLNTLLKRLDVLIPEYKLQQLTKPTVISAELVDMEEVVRTIKSKYTCFGIKDVRIDILRQSVAFKIFGSCYIPNRYKGYRVLERGWSAVQTEEFDYLNVVEEKYAEENIMPITAFTSGIKVEIV